MNFMDSIKNEISNEKSFTENGAVQYAPDYSNILNLNFATSSMRNWSSQEIEDKFVMAYYNAPLTAIKWLFYLRDCRGGMGERRTFRICMKWLANNKSDVVKKLLPLISEYGRWDDIVDLIDSNVSEDVVKLIDEQLVKDIENHAAGKSISLLAKWMPSSNTSSKDTRIKARKIIKGMKISEKNYRKILAKLRAYTKVVETQMSANKWSEIDYTAVPSMANIRYESAFLKRDEKRRTEYLKSLSNGEVKINASVAFPSDIVAKYNSTNRYRLTVNDTYEGMWKALPDYVGGDDGTLVIRDGSGSMLCKIGNTNTCALDVSTALAIYFAEHMKGQFHDKYITFSAKPQIVNMEHCQTLSDKINMSNRYTDCSNTDIEKVFDLILDTAINHDMSQDEMPKNLLIVSDMEFDMARRASYYEPDKWNKTLFENFAKRYEEHGYKLPRIIFWNVMSRTNGIPLKENELGVALVSGFSPATYNMVLSDELDPLKCLLDILDSERYLPVAKALEVA